MKELTVIELSEQTGLTRSQIYHLNKKHNLINLNNKINYEYAFPIITATTIKKAKKENEKNFRQILNMLILQNTALQKQLNLANEREKNYLSELTSCHHSFTQKPTLTPPIDLGNTQSALENDLNNIDEKSQNPMQSENEMCAPNESRNGDNTETESVGEPDTQPLSTVSIQNELILSESDKSDGEPSRQKNEVIEQKDNALFSTPSPNQDDTKRPPTLKIRSKKVTATIAALIPKSIPITVRRNLSDNQQKSPSPTNESITDQNSLNKKDHHDY